MARYTILSAVIAISMMSGTAFAKNKKSDNYMVVKDANGVEARVLKAQFIRPGDVSPEEYARLLAEADRIRAYQSQGIPVQNQQPHRLQQNVQYQQNAQVQYAPQVQYAQQPQYTGQVQLANPLPPQANARQLTYNSMSGKKPQSYADYMAAKRAMLAQAQVQQQPAQPAPIYMQQPAPAPRYVTPGQPVYLQPQPQVQQQAYIPAPQPTVRYQPPANNRVIYAAMPDVMGTGPAVQTIVTPGPRTAVGHSVIKGDTLYSLAKRYGVNLGDLKAANGLSSNVISVGQVLAIPGVVAAPQPQYVAPVAVTAPVRYQTPAQGTSRYYTRTSTTTAAPAAPKVIRAVQPVPASGIYAVLKDDTIYSIANFACVNPYDVAKLNGLVDTTNLLPGQKLKMPAGHCLNN